MHETIANQRYDYLHKVSHPLVSESQATYIAMEDLNVKGMMKNKKLARHIGDASWGMFKTMLTYKADWNAKKVIVIDRFLPSSKVCSCCGHKMDKMPLHIRHWQCPVCHQEHDRDVNAAKNIAQFLQLQLADGLGLSPVVKSSLVFILVSASETAKDACFFQCMHGSQDASPIISQSLTLKI